MDSSVMVPQSARLTPTPVVGGLAFQSLTAGRYHTCGIAWLVLSTAGATACTDRWGVPQLVDLPQ
jgi:hypothetical protein